MGKQVNCVKLGQTLEGLDAAPVPGELGQRVLDNVSKQAWEEWIVQQTMLINEHRLNLRDAEARKFLMTEMEKYFFGDQ
jgi:Fe-S cluster biosynthesis and repair protein YggX